MTKTVPEGYTSDTFLALVLERCGDIDPATVDAFLHDECTVDGYDGLTYLRESADFAEVDGVWTQHYVCRDDGTYRVEDWWQ